MEKDGQKPYKLQVDGETKEELISNLKEVTELIEKGVLF